MMSTDTRVVALLGKISIITKFPQGRLKVLQAMPTLIKEISGSGQADKKRRFLGFPTEAVDTMRAG